MGNRATTVWLMDEAQDARRRLAAGADSVCALAYIKILEAVFASALNRSRYSPNLIQGPSARYHVVPVFREGCEAIRAAFVHYWRISHEPFITCFNAVRSTQPFRV